MSAREVRGPIASIYPLSERNGALRDDDDKIIALVQAAVDNSIGKLERQHHEEMKAFRAVAERMENGFAKLSDTIEAFVIGDSDLAVAGVVDGESRELPNLPRYKADATIVYRLTATDIAQALGIPMSTVSYFLGPNGLNWVTQKPDLWNREFFRMTKRRLWHLDIVGLLRRVILDEQHEDRVGLSEACLHKMDDASAIIARDS